MKRKSGNVFLTFPFLAVVMACLLAGCGKSRRPSEAEIKERIVKDSVLSDSIEYYIRLDSIERAED